MFLQVHPSFGGKIDSYNYQGKLSNFGIYVVYEFLYLKNNMRDKVSISRDASPTPPPCPPIARPLGNILSVLLINHNLRLDAGWTTFT